MAVAIRLSRGGAKKRPYYRIVVADGRSPRDGKYLEQIGTYNPMLAKDDPARVKLDEDRARHWLGVGAKPSDRVHRFLDAAGILERTPKNNPKKGEPGEAAKERAEEKAAKAAEAEEAAMAATEEAAAEDAATEETAAEETTAEEAPAEEETATPAEEAAAEDGPADETPAEGEGASDGEEAPAEEASEEAAQEEKAE